MEATCASISAYECERLKKGAKKKSYKKLVAMIKEELPDLYECLSLDFYNPYCNQTYATKTHYILTHSATEYFIRK